jgi:hypothetical protein
MGTHEEFLQLCAIATSGDLTGEERNKLEEHLKACPSCRQAMKEYRAAADGAARAFASDCPPEETLIDHSWSVEKAETTLLERLKEESRPPQSDESDAHENLDTTVGRRFTYRPSRIRWREVWMPFAACILLALALGIAAYRIGIRRGAEVTERNVPPPPSSTGSLQEQLSDAGHERAQLMARLSQEDKTIGDLQRQLEGQAALLNKIKTTSGEMKTIPESGPTAGASVKEPQDQTTAQFEAAQAKLQELQKRIDIETEEKQQAATRAAVLEGKVEDLTQVLRDRERTVDQQQEEISKQQELLDHDRDIRDLMGARDLYIAEVYDVARTGQTNKTYGRVFYTKGKSLVFYAYDLDQQGGFKNASSFQAWGRRGPDKTQALNLGIFYEDNANKKRWMLKFDDPKSLEQIDAVFVTIEPNGGSHRPSGKQLLFAYLRVSPNHP